MAIKYNKTTKRVNIILLSGIISIYAFFSSPTPDEISYAEILIAIFFIILLGAYTPYFLGGFVLYPYIERVPIYAWIAFIYLLFVPSVYGLIIKNNTVNDFIRDFIPFLYFFMPLFLINILQRNKLFWVNALPYLIAIIGVLFSIRFFLVSGKTPIDVGTEYISDKLLYFPMDPSVLFSATFLLLRFIANFNFSNLKTLILSVLMFIAGFICFLALAGFLVRAQIFLVIFSLFVYMLFLLRKNPFKILLLFSLIFLLFFYFFSDQFISLFILLINKFRTVGFNSRDLEYRAVMNEFVNSVSFMILGSGWGGLINNPVIWGMKVRYVHNLYLYFIFKTGLIGFVFFLLYIFFILKRFAILLRNYNKSLIYLLPIINVLIVFTILEAGFKNLSFGLILSYLILISYNFKDIKYGSDHNK